ncbi:hypothetical protein PHYBOEH_003527 [Phytophthora boehmeriae]|uniref:Protein kinase domain-containing protein n=1 Tax=Phytophthora boehmeriae TaxID=109152 RepID=A0A8T1XDB6_9STRA|nr:hypothetical protein PHYBOEH_003527 [Phytophthora boehmeriae]
MAAVLPSASLTPGTNNHSTDLALHTPLDDSPCAKKRPLSPVRALDDVAEVSETPEILQTPTASRCAGPGSVSPKAATIDPHDLKLLKVIGRGTFAKQVALAKHNETQSMYAVKTLDKSKLVQRKQVVHTLTEKKVMEQLGGHPFIVKCYSAFQTDRDLNFVLEYCQGGELFFHLQQQVSQKFDENATRFYAAEDRVAITVAIFWANINPSILLKKPMEDEQLMAAQDDAGSASVADATELSSGSLSASTEPARAPTVTHELGLCSDGVRSLVGVELPVYGSNITKVLETVGGLHTLQQAHEAKSQFLPVKLRPTEPSCKPLFADLTKTQMILLRVKRTRPKRKRAAAAGEKESGRSTDTGTDGSRLKAQVVGLVREKYVCEGMADFQYLTARSLYPTPVPTKDTITVTEDQAVVNNAIDAAPLSKPSTRQLELQASLRPYLEVEKEEQLELIPEVFSKVDLPLKYEFRQRSGYLPTAAAKKPANTMAYLNFHDDVPAPAGPKPDQPVLRRRSVGVEDNVETHVLEVLQAKLKSKPVWLRSKLFHGLDALERRAARRLLRKLCYVFVDGPWRGSWVRMGYDPRAFEVSDTASRYQVVELRNNRELVHSKVTHPTRKRTKKFVTASSGNANGENTHVKGPRIVKVTQTSALENAQASKRRRKERFSRGETRRSYLVEPTPSSSPTGAELTPQPSPDTSVTNDWESDNDLQDKEKGVADASDDGADDTSSTAGTSTVQTANGVSEKEYEIFGVQLTSANVLFQLDEIDDEEVREWIDQFTKQTTPSLLGGWYPTQMFLPLREIIRLRIASLVGRSKAELESRRKRLDALKKQALSDYADELAGNKRSTNTSQQKSNGDNGTTGSASIRSNTVATAEEEEELAFERSLIRERNAGSSAPKLSATDGAETGEDDDGDDDIESQEDEDDVNSANGRSRAVFEEDEDDDDQEEEDQAQPKLATLAKQDDEEKKSTQDKQSKQYSF